MDPKSSVDNHLVSRALRGETTPRTPVWLMRQAGRFDPAYRRYRESCGLELEALFSDGRRAAEITMLPLRYGVDALVLFQDILTPLGPMGAPFRFRPGPKLERPIDDAEAAERLVEYEPTNRLPFVFESIERVLDLLGDRAPLLGFAGAPLTLLAFLVKGGSPGSDPRTLQEFLRSHPEPAARLLDRLAAVTVSYLRAQIDAGVHAVQLFESGAGLLDERGYRRWALPYQRTVLSGVADLGVPTILFARETAPDLLAEAGATVLSLGSQASIGSTRARFPGLGLQGNVDNDLLRDGTPEEVAEATRECIREGGHRGHVLNLSHGLHRDTPVENVESLIGCAREYTCHDSDPRPSLSVDAEGAEGP